MLLHLQIVKTSLGCLANCLTAAGLRGLSTGLGDAAPAPCPAQRRPAGSGLLMGEALRTHMVSSGIKTHVQLEASAPPRVHYHTLFSTRNQVGSEGFCYLQDKKFENPVIVSSSQHALVPCIFPMKRLPSLY